jgi:hypothetical protein
VTGSDEGPGPFDLVFGAGIDDRLFPSIAEEAGARSVPTLAPDQFLFLTGVGRLLQAIAGPDAEPGEEGGGHGVAMKQHGILLYHAFHYWSQGKHELQLDEERLRRALDAPPGTSASGIEPPGPAGYVRLPRNLVWAAAGPGLRPEPADGFFWTVEPRSSRPYALHVLLALGLRPDRPGFSVVTATASAAPDLERRDVPGRPDGRDFATTLPGGELGRLYSLETTAELLGLAQRCFRELARIG